MIIDTEKTVKALQNMAEDEGTHEFAILPPGRLVVKKGKYIEAFEYKIIVGNNFIQRDGLDIRGDFSIPPEGRMLAFFNDRKYLSLMQDGTSETATAKKPLSSEHSIIISASLEHRRVLFVADGKFASQPYFLILADTHSNKSFAEVLIRKLRPDIDWKDPMKKEEAENA